ncbi:MAG: hypothetical protein GC160_29615 [Acidobacteria bacterium]|nr:hypothetical protein [Acidobacteriota bacterium]
MRRAPIAAAVAFALVFASARPTPAQQPAENPTPAEKPAPEEKPAETEPPVPRRGGGKILLPGAGAYEPAPSSAPAEAGPPETEPPKLRRSAAPTLPPAAPSEAPAEAHVPAVAPAAPAAPLESKTSGELFWSGRIYKNGRIRISVDNQTTAGSVEGDPLPGVPATIDARSPIVVILQQPNARDGYKSFEFQVTKSSKDPVSLNFHWSLSR